MEIKLQLTTHGRQRIQQRGFKDEIISLLLTYGDYARGGGKGVYRVSLGRNSLTHLLECNGLSSEVKMSLRKHYDALIKKVLIVHDFIVITAFNNYQGVMR